MVIFVLSLVLYSHFWRLYFASSALSSIVAGTVAERCKMQAYLFYSAFLVGFVYPVVAHSFWSVNGWLSNTTLEPLWGSGAIDLAGSGPVHMCGGVTALASAIILGPRIGRFYDRDGNPLEEPHDFPPHSVALQFLGTFCLWCTYLAFCQNVERGCRYLVSQFSYLFIISFSWLVWCKSLLLSWVL
jgi:Amt family ammonium transporter